MPVCWARESDKRGIRPHRIGLPQAARPQPHPCQPLLLILLRDFRRRPWHRPIFESFTLDQEQQRSLAFIRRHPDVETLYDLTRSFVKLMKERDFEAFDLWLTKGERCGLPDVETFTQGLQNDYQTRKTSLPLPYSNGPVEGQINRLKFVKRSMFGRGSFELLRSRFLEAA